MTGPQQPGNFAQQLKAIRQIDNTDEMASRLQQLACTNLTFLEALQLSRAIESAQASLPVVKLAILSSTTCDHLVGGIRVSALRRGLGIDVWCGQYGQYRQEVMQPAAPLLAFAPDYILFVQHAAHLAPGIALHASHQEVDEAIAQSVADLAQLWSRAATTFDATVIQQTCIERSEPVFGSFDRVVPGSPYAITQKLNHTLATQAAAHNVGVLDVARQVSRDGLAHWFDETRWLQAKMEIAPNAMVDFGELLVRHLCALRGDVRKCLVLDLDNTLWGGVVGDDGVEGLVIGEGSGAGEAFLSLQRYALALKARGIVLAVCSKNELDAARAPFLQHPDMLLKLSDFAAFVANWEDKAANLQAIAAQFNLGLESLVFVDDNPAERERVRAALPMVAVPELPEDPAAFVACIANQGYFEAVTFTADDQQRADQYAANAERNALRTTAVSMDDYLAGLHMTMTSGPITPVDLARATQLIGKTNQFNTTTRRYTHDQVQAFANDQNGLTLVARLADKFGDNGLVSVAILVPDDQHEDALRMVSWVMSCRVFGRQLEHQMMNIIVQKARQRGKQTLIGEFISSPKNTVISSLFADFGFAQSTPEPATPGLQEWTLGVAGYTPVRTRIGLAEC